MPPSRWLEVWSLRCRTRRSWVRRVGRPGRRRGVAAREAGEDGSLGSWSVSSSSPSLGGCLSSPPEQKSSRAARVPRSSKVPRVGRTPLAPWVARRRTKGPTGPRGYLRPYPGSPYLHLRPLETPALTVDGVLIARGKVLLVRRGRPPWQGMWALPGGFVEIGESCESAVVREVEEETGLRTVVEGLTGVYSDPSRDPRGHIVTVAFHVRRVSGKVLGGDDAAEAQWFPLDALPRFAADHARILREALALRGRGVRRRGAPRRGRTTSRRRGKPRPRPSAPR